MTTQPCGCGTFGGAPSHICSPRSHHIWQCPSARAVREQIDRHLLPTGNDRGAHGPTHLWLIQAPPGCGQPPVGCDSPGSPVRHGTWQVLPPSSNPGGSEAVETAAPGQPPRSQLRPRAEQGPRQLAITDFFTRSGNPLVQAEEEAPDTQPGTPLTQAPQGDHHTRR
ncbi:hypothetical protein VaNZ11_009525 [Volvox africanus]|uniref:Uncharacterized protein n=1 Tax=Volvox africanus TaxID=51714 RepID=A0ABQ5S9L8_9CHLO|nr:hypothetical protein VaNZ11_009525 [Volvox africanus]